MLVAYLDESEDRQLCRYYVGALILDGESATSTVSAMEAIAEDASERFAVSPDIELHGYDLLNGSGVWKCLEGKVRARLGVFREALRALGGENGQFLVRAVDTLSLREAPGGQEVSSHEVTLVHLLQTLDRIAEERGDYILVIADEHHLAGSLREQLRRWRAEGTPGHYKKTYLARIVDTIHFTPSKESRLLQASDLLLYFHQRYESRSSRRDPREMKFLEEIKEVIARLEHPDSGLWSAELHETPGQ